MEDRAIVQCTTCGTPGTVIFGEDGLIKQAFFLCRCPRPTVEEANKEINAQSRRDTRISNR